MKIINQILHMRSPGACVKNAERHGDTLMCRKCAEKVGFLFSSEYGGEYDSIHMHPEYKPYKLSLSKDILDVERRKV